MLTKTLRIKHEDYYRRLDKVPDTYEMIYKSPLHYTINVGKELALGTPCFAAAVILYFKWFGLEEEAKYFVSFHAADQNELGIFFASLLILNIFVYRVCHITTLRIYRNQDS